ncbi:MAG: YceI family protein [Actinomycetota bacterium]
MSVTLRKEAGLQLPQAGTWVVDRAHSTVEFSVRHLMVSKVRGGFGTFDASLNIAEKPEDSSVTATIDASSINTRDEKRDAHLRSADFFDTETFPTWTFRSVGLRPTSNRTFALDGELTIRGVSKPVTLAVEYGGLVDDPWGNTRAIFSAETEIDREEFGLTWNQALEAGGVLVSRNVTIELEIQAVPQR